MTIQRIPDITMMISAIDADKHDFQWFMERFGKAITAEIAAHLYHYACESQCSKYYTLTTYVDMIDVSKARFVRTEMVME